MAQSVLAMPNYNTVYDINGITTINDIAALSINAFADTSNQPQNLVVGASSNIEIEAYESTNVTFSDKGSLSLYNFANGDYANKYKILNINNDSVTTTINAPQMRLDLQGTDPQVTTGLSLTSFYIDNDFQKIATSMEGFMFDDYVFLNSNLVVNSDIVGHQNLAIGGNIFSKTTNLYKNFDTTNDTDLSQIAYAFFINTNNQLELLRYEKFGTSNVSTRQTRINLWGDGSNKGVSGIYNFGQSNYTVLQEYGGLSAIRNVNSNGFMTGVSGGQNIFKTDDSNIYLLQSNVGIGTALPSVPLDVNGAIRATTYCNLFLDDLTSTSIYYAPTASNLSYVWENVSYLSNSLIPKTSFSSNLVVALSNALFSGAVGGGGSGGSNDLGTYMMAFATSNDLYPNVNYVISLGRSLSNAVYSGELSARDIYSSNLSTITSNTLYPRSQYACNLTITMSNTLYSKSIFASNTSAFASNKSIFSSNVVVTLSNVIYTSGITGNSNLSNYVDGVFASNLAITTSNLVYQNSNLLSGVSGYGDLSNIVYETSNSLYPSTTFSSNKSAWASNAIGTSVRTTGATMSGNITIVSSNVVSPPIYGLSNNITKVDIALAVQPNQFSTYADSNDLVIRNTSVQSKIHLQQGSNAAALTINSNNTVGISTNAPIEALHVAGKIYSTTQILVNSNDSVSSPAFAFYQDSNTGVSHPANDSLGLVTGGTERVRIDSSGRIGINTSNPLYTLDINGTALLRNGNSAKSFLSNQLLFGYNNTATYMHSIKTRHNSTANNSSNSLDFYVWQTTDSSNAIGTKQVMSVTSDGVGVFTSNPSYALDVQGTTRCTGYLTVGSATSNTNAIFFAGTPGDTSFSYSGIINRNYDPSYSSNVATDFSELLLVQFNDAGSSFGPDRIRHLAGAHKWQVYNSSIGTVTDSNSFFADTNYTTAMYINPTGNVGIGTSNPSYPLDVTGVVKGSGLTANHNNVSVNGQGWWVSWNRGGSDGASYYMNQKGGGIGGHIFGEVTTNNTFTEYMRLSGTGNLGIGTTGFGAFDVPVERLYVAGKVYSTSQILAHSNDSATAPGFAFYQDSNTGVSHPANDSLGIVTGGTERVRVDSTGNVGIGTSVPSTMLDVNGSVRIASNLTVVGNLTVSGNTTAITSTTVNIVDNMIQVNNGAAYNAGLQAGIEVNRGTGYSNYYFVFDEATSHFKIGKTEQLQTVATREDTPVGTNTIPYYDSTSARYLSSSNLVFNNNRLGVGTTTPVYTLDVNGPTLLRNGNSNQILFGWNNQASYMHSIKTRHNGGVNDINNAFDFFVWQTTDAVGTIGTKHIMSATSVGVGIGKSNPEIPLDVVGQIKTSSGLVINSSTYTDTMLNAWSNTAYTSSNALSSYLPLNGGTMTGDLTLNRTNAGSISFSNNKGASVQLGLSYITGQWAAGAESNDFVLRNMYPSGKILLQQGVGVAALTVNSNNFVGIGTSTPSQALDVVGSARIASNLTVVGNLTISGTTTTVTSTTVNIVDNMIQVNNGAVYNAGLQAGIEVNRGNGYSNYYFVFDEATDYFRVGTTGQLQTVATREDSPVANTVPYYDTAAARYISTPSFAFSNNRLGVGVTAPLETVHVSGKIYSTSQILADSNDSSNAPAFSFLQDSNTGLSHPSIDSLGFVTAGAERVRVDSQGFVGVGVSNPSMTLDVNGGARFSSNIITSSTGTLGVQMLLNPGFFDLSDTSNVYSFAEPGNPSASMFNGGFFSGSNCSGQVLNWRQARVMIRGCSLGTSSNATHTLLNICCYNSNTNSNVVLSTMTCKDEGVLFGYTTNMSGFFSLSNTNMPLLGIQLASSNTTFRVGPTSIFFS